MAAVFTTRTNQGLQLLLCLKRGKVRVDFTPIVMFGNTSHARYTTDDKEIIDELKNHKHFNSFFFLEREDSVVEEIAPKVETTIIVDYRTLCKNPDSIVEEFSVVDVATAQNWCQRVHGAVFRGRKAETIKTEAAEKYNTVFPNFN